MTPEETSKPGRRKIAKAIVALGLMAGCFLLGYAAHKYLLLPDWMRAGMRSVGERLMPEVDEDSHPGWWHPVHESRADPAVSQELIEKLNALGYLGGYNAADAEGGVNVHVPQLAFAGHNLYSSGHAPEAFLMDMDGTLLHRWSFRLEDVWPDYERSHEVTAHSLEYWRRVRLLENGDLLAIFEGIGLLRLDKHSNLIWANRCNAHHEAFVHDDGTISVLTRKAHVVPRVHPDKPILEDFVTLLSPDGEILREVSLLEAFENSIYAPILTRTLPWGDIFHTNTLEFLDGRLSDRSAIFADGNLLTSLRSLDLVAIVDLEAVDVLWARTGMWSEQHDPSLLENGNLLLFDNKGNDGRSQVVEFNLLSQEIEWSYGTADEEPLFSAMCGASERLPNGNTLITESFSGRALEVTASGEIAWQFVSPHRTGADNELVAVLTEMTRLGPDFDVDWADPGTVAGSAAP